MDDEVVAAFDRYVRVRGHQLLRTAFLLTGDRLTAEELVQNALASVLVSWRRVPEISDLDAYMYTAMVNARSRWWSRRMRVELPAEYLPERPGPDETRRYDNYDAIVTALRTLPERQRAALVLRYFEDLTEEQTAGVLGCSVGTVKSQTSRGLSKLRAVLADDVREPR